MGIDHDMVFGGFLDAVLIMVIHELGIMMLADGQDIAYITGFDGRVLVFIHELIGSIKPPFVVTDSA